MNIFKSRNFFLSILIILFIIIDYSKFSFLNGERGLIEILQLIFIGLALLINLYNYKLQLKYVNKWIYSFKNFILIFLFYEEISFLTANLFPFLKNFNDNSEFNLHNSSIFWKTFNEVTFLGVDNIELYLYTIITVLVLFIIGFGSYFKFLSKFNYLFFEKRNSFFSLIYVANLFLSYLFRHLNMVSNGEHLINNFEAVELVIYALLLFDVFDKINKYRKIYLSSKFNV